MRIIVKYKEGKNKPRFPDFQGLIKLMIQQKQGTIHCSFKYKFSAACLSHKTLQLRTHWFI